MNGNSLMLLADMTTGARALCGLAALAVIALAGGLHWIRRPEQPPLRWLLSGARLLATLVAWWLVLKTINEMGDPKSDQGQLHFATTWSLGLCALLGAIGTEAIIALYRFERQSVSAKMGGTLVTLRLSLLVIGMYWLLQPSWYKEWPNPNIRTIGVVIDDSASMKLSDADAPAGDKLDLAELFGVEVKGRPAPMRETQRKLSQLQQRLGSQLQVLELLSPTDASSSRQMESRLGKLKELTTSSRETLAAVSQSLQKPGGDKLQLDNATTALITGLQTQIKSLQDGPLGRLEKLAAAGPESQAASIQPTREDLRTAIDTLGRINVGLTDLPIALDEAYWRGLPADKRQEIQKHTSVARAAIARRVMQSKDKTAKEARDQQLSFAERLNDKYALKFYHFASQPGVVKLESYGIKPKYQESPADKQAAEARKARDEKDKGKEKDTPAVVESKPAVKPPGQGPSAPGVDDQTPGATAWRSATDLAAALKQVTEDIPSGLSGVIVLTDGRHNVDDAVQPWSDKIRAQKARISTVLIGSRHVPKDAAVSGLEAPQTVMSGDKVTVKANLKLDGYRGESVVVRLMRGNEEVNRKTVPVPEDRHRAKVEFTDTTKQVGTYPYRVEILSGGGTPLKESVSVNDNAEKAVAVTDDRIKLLYIESHPRWDFRYLRNLFAGPDRLVHLQYVLTNPTRLADTPLPPPVHVSASRPYGQFEGTLLPENEKEWMKFDVIILGDLGPSTMTKETIEMLDKFVHKRGGTLVVLGGADYMPHAYADTKLGGMLPMRTEKIEGALRQGPEPGYRVRLTDEGKEHVVMKQLAGTDSEQFWRSLPVLRWRHPKTRAKEGAITLAYAESAYQEAGRGLNQQRLERDNALICLHRYGAGKVLMVSFDESWRLRYRVGVAYHHRFWGQVVRWAADEKLPAGTAMVRLGTDQPRYDVGKRVLIKARLLNEKGDPVTEGEVEANIFQGEKKLETVKLDADPDIPGRFRGELSGSKLPAGVYRVELGGPTVATLLAGGDLKKVETDIAVSASKSTSELVELTADDTVPQQLAAATQGRVVTPLEAGSLFELLGPPSGEDEPDKRDYPIWDNIRGLLLFLGICSAEWILRKKAGLT